MLVADKTPKMALLSPTLFVEEEKTKSIQVFQGNAITDARYEMTVLEKQIVYVLLSQIKKEERAHGLLNYRVYIKDIEKYSPKTITNYQV